MCITFKTNIFKQKKEYDRKNTAQVQENGGVPGLRWQGQRAHTTQPCWASAGPSPPPPVRPSSENPENHLSTYTQSPSPGSLDVNW